MKIVKREAQVSSEEVSHVEEGNALSTVGPTPTRVASTGLEVMTKVIEVLTALAQNQGQAHDRAVVVQAIDAVRAIEI